MAYSEKHYKALDDLYDYMSDILKHYNALIPVLKDELKAIIDDDTVALDASMNAQQAIILKTRYFDEKIAEFSKNIEVPGTTLAELAENLPSDDGARFVKLHEDFKLTVEEVLFYRNKCKNMLTSKLNHIGKVLANSGNQKDMATYDITANEVQTSLFPKSFQTKI